MTCCVGGSAAVPQLPVQRPGQPGGLCRVPAPPTGRGAHAGRAVVPGLPSSPDADLWDVGGTGRVRSPGPPASRGVTTASRGGHPAAAAAPLLRSAAAPARNRCAPPASIRIRRSGTGARSASTPGSSARTAPATAARSLNGWTTSWPAVAGTSRSASPRCDKRWSGCPGRSRRWRGPARLGLDRLHSTFPVCGSRSPCCPRGPG
jgi:hypothetical protein